MSDRDGLTLIFDDGDSVMFRRIAGQSPAPGPDGADSETAAHAIVGQWGMPDFVLKPKKLTSGKKNLELSDGIVLAHDIALILQVKRRVAEPGTPEQEGRWLSKNLTKAIRQAKGTKRQLDLVEGSATFTNLRERQVELELPTSQAGVVLIDHPSPPPGFALDFVATSGGSLPIVTLLRRDWDFLFGQLQSTYAVAKYLIRVAQLEPCKLGEESARYYDLASADRRATPGPVPALFGTTAKGLSEPILPLEPVEQHQNADGLLIFRQIMEDIARSPFDHGEMARIRALSMLDTVPVVARLDLALLLVERLQQVHEAAAVEGGTAWKFRMIAQHPPLPFLCFATTSALNEELNRSGFCRGSV